MLIGSRTTLLFLLPGKTSTASIRGDTNVKGLLGGRAGQNPLTRYLLSPLRALWTILATFYCPRRDTLESQRELVSRGHREEILERETGRTRTFSRDRGVRVRPSRKSTRPQVD